MHKRRAVAGIATALALATTVGTAPATFAQAVFGSGGAVTVPIIANPGSINPIYAADTYGRAIVSLLYPSLGALQPNGTTKPLLAKRWAVSAKGRTVTFTIRSGLTWTNGKPVTASDVAATFRAMADLRDGSPYVGVFRDMTDVAAPNAATVVVTLSQADSAFVADCLALPVAPASVLVPLLARPRTLRTSTELNARPDVTAGPFRFVSWKQATDTLTFAANGAYPWGAPRIARLTVQYYATSELAWEAFLHGQVAMANVPASMYSQAMAMAAKGAFRVSEVPTSQYWYIAFNFRNVIWSDARVRQAAIESVDPKALEKAIGPLAPQATTGPAPFGAAATGGIGYSPRHANALLADAGWVMAANGVRYKHGSPLTITLETVSGVSSWGRVIGLVVDDLRRVGFEVSVKTATFHDLSNDLASPRGANMADAYALAWDQTPGSDAQALFGGRAALPPWGQNVGAYEDPTVTSAIQTLDSAGLGAARRRQTLSTLKDALHNDPPAIFLPTPMGLVAREKGLVLPTTRIGTGSALDWPQLWALKTR